MTVLELYISVRKVANTLEERQKVEAVLDSYLSTARESCRSRRA